MRVSQAVAVGEETRHQPPSRPPGLNIAAGVYPPPIWCTPAQHVWLQIPASWRCQCGAMEVVNGDEAEDSGVDPAANR